MAEQPVEIEIPLLLPGVGTDDDACIGRLEEALRNQKGIRRVHVHRDKASAVLCLHYDSDIVALSEVRRLATRAGADIDQRYRHALWTIEGMDCSDCITAIEHGVGRLDGVLTVQVSYPAQKMRVEFDARQVDERTIKNRVRALGYSLPDRSVGAWYRAQRELIFCLLAGTTLLAGWGGAALLDSPLAATTALYLATYFFGGWDIARHAWRSLLERHLDTDVLMLMAALGAAALGELAEGGLLLFLFSLGHVLEERALDRARSAIRSLAALTPATALVKRDGKEVEMPIADIHLADVVVVRPGERVPVDGDISAGRSSINQAPVTGESVPVDKAPGERVFAGSVNGEGALEVKVTKLAQDSTLARVMKMVEESQTEKSPTQQTVAKFERIFVPSVLLGTVLVIVVPPLLGASFTESFLRAMTLLVAASPCALALGTPASILAGIAQAAKNGVLIKGGVHLESLGHLTAIAFDKTGTITHGRPEVTDIVALSGSEEETADNSTLLALTGAIEARSAHPLAQAVVRAAEAAGVVLPAIGEVESITGRGLRSTTQGQTVLIGNVALLEESGIVLSTAVRTRIESLQTSGKTIMVVASAGRVAGILALADTVRPDAAPALNKLRDIGLRELVMLSGDNERVAATIAASVGLTSYRADLMPEGKVTAVRSLIDTHGPTAMVGDGVNDAPALANATVGIAMGGAGSDVALETADVALMADDLSKLPFAVGLGRRTRAVIMQNLAIALGVITLLIIASLVGWTGMAVAISFHEGSTLLVVLNALRLLRYRDA